MKNRLKQKTGESIAETLVAVLIMAVAFLMLTGAVVTAARINNRIKNADVSFAAGTSEEPSPSKVTISLDGIAAEVEVTVYQTETENGYYYYYYEAR